MSLARVARALLPLAVIAAGAGGAWWLLATAPEPGRATPRRDPTMVDARAIVVEDVDVLAEAFGTVVPAREVALAPQVTGRVVELAPELVPGGSVGAGDLLLRVEPDDYELAVEQAEAALEQARADLALEEGRRLVAEREWERFGPELETLGDEAERAKSRALALREPQLRRMRSLVSAAETSLAEARLQLDRTTLRAPFAAVVLEETVEVGLIVRSGETVARLAGTGEFWIRASLPQARSAGVAAAGHLPVRVELSGAAGVLEGRLLRLLPSLDVEGRMAQVLVAVEDPLRLAAGDADANGGGPHLPPLALGSYVRLELPAGRLADVVRVPRAALRENDRVWLVGGDGRLRVREVDVVWRAAEDVLVRGDFGADERLVTSYLSSPLSGMELSVRASEDGAGGEG